MLEDKYKKLWKKENLRETLSELRSEAKEPQALEELKQLAGDGSRLVSLLSNEDAKVRKNAALLLGDMEIEEAAAPLFEAYQTEQTLFVRSSYLSAMRKLEVNEYLGFFKARLAELKRSEAPEEQKKHVGEEIRELYGIVIQAEGLKKHTFTGFRKPHEMLLTTNREQREVTLKEVQGLSAAVQRRAELHPLGVQVFSKEAAAFTRLRTYRELLFPIKTEGMIGEQPDVAANVLWTSGFFSFLQECHKGEETFFFRIDVKGENDRPQFAKKLGAALERLSGWRLINASGEYEVEIRLLHAKSGSFIPFLKLHTIPMRRFSYRRRAVSASIHPATAAMMMQLAKPYLKEDAQILDPCCGVGTMLIERDICVPAGDMYGIDIFGEAIEIARENASLAGERIHFVHRDFFDFKHEYKFDEIITNMPVKGKKTKEETDVFYQRFFEKSKRLLGPGGLIIMYTNEAGFVKKQLRLTKDYRLLEEFCIREKDHFHLYIMKKV